MLGTSVDPTELSIGQLVGKYRVESLVGRGGMATVYRGVHVELDQQVAIKTLLPEYSTDDRLVARFIGEAKTIAKIRSEHVARVFDVGRLEETNAPYIVLEFLEGEDLGKRLDADVLPIEKAVDYVIQACEGLSRAHALGIVHRDVKPGNLFLSVDGDGNETIKVIDFGIAKQARADGFKLTSTSDVFGSPQYMAPEQIRAAHDVDARTDIWALGIVLYELLTGVCAFAAANVLELAAAILHATPTPIGIYRRDVSTELERVLMRCLERDPAKRFSNVYELVFALAPFASAEGAAKVEEMRRSRERVPVLGGDGAAFELTALAGARKDDSLGDTMLTGLVPTPRPARSPMIDTAAPTTTIPDPPKAFRGAKRVPVAALVAALAAFGVGIAAWAYGARDDAAKTAKVDPASAAGAAPPPATQEPTPSAVESAIPPPATSSAAPIVKPPLPSRPPATFVSARPRPADRGPPQGRTTTIVPRKGGD